MANTPLYQQVATKIETAIREGTLPSGSRIENEVSLADRLKLSRPPFAGLFSRWWMLALW